MYITETKGNGVKQKVDVICASGGEADALGRLGAVVAGGRGDLFHPSQSWKIPFINIGKALNRQKKRFDSFNCALRRILAFNCIAASFPPLSLGVVE